MHTGKADYLPRFSQRAALKVQFRLQYNTPLEKPNEAQLLPSRFGPSHCSAPHILPSPQKVQTSVLKAQPLVQDKVSPEKPKEAQLLPPRSAPSHCSFPPRLPSPHTLRVQCPRPILQSALQVRVPPA